MDRNTNRGEFSSPGGFGGDQRHFADLTFWPDPFHQAPGAARDNQLGYSWPPHLYQGLFKVEENACCVNARMEVREWKRQSRRKNKKAPGA